MAARPDEAPAGHGRRRDFDIIETSETVAADGAEVHEAEVRVPADLLYFCGHFPGDPLLPGVAQLDRLAVPRAAGRWPDLGPLVKIKRLKFIGPIRPGDRVRLRLERRSPGSLVVALSIWADDACRTSASLVFGGRELP
jgi:3-hydroxymyristoyl/3-hydroxydecanoyl-(acyl carrier protein) dehydratase